MTTDIVTQSMAASMIVKVIIDIIKYYNRERELYVPGYTWPILAITFGIVACTLLSLANGIAFSWQNVAQNIIAGILAAGQAIGITELQKRA
jgi:hypothetical protein